MDWNQAIIEEFRANGGRVGGRLEGAPLLLLHSTGAKTGKRRVHPVMYQDLGDGRVAVFASKGGAPTNPDWYHNLLANPRARIELGSETVDVVARVARGEERDLIWTRQKRRYPAFAQYERQTRREIPVVILERVSVPARGRETERSLSA
jgi:deazaflavin-dependent oxidoreductase (nitroreductase family)